MKSRGTMEGRAIRRGESNEGIRGAYSEPQEEFLMEEEELSFEERLKRLTMSKEEILKEDAERAKKRAKELKENIEMIEDSRKEVQALRDSVLDIFG